MGIEPFGFEEDLVTVTIPEAVDLVLDRGTIARTLPADRTAEERRTIEIGPNDIMRRLVGPGHGAEDLRVAALLRQWRHHPLIGIAGLFGEACPVDRATVEPRRRSGLEPREGQACLPHLSGEPLCRILADPSARQPLFAAEQRSSEKRPGAENNGLRRDGRAVGENEARNPLSLQVERRRFAFDHGKIALPLHHAMDGCLEQAPVCLDTWPPNGRAFRAVEHPVMDRGGIRGPPDDPVKRVDLAHEMAFAQSSDGRITAHCADSIAREGNQPDSHTHACSRRGRFHAGVAAADYKDIEL